MQLLNSYWSREGLGTSLTFATSPTFSALWEEKPWFALYGLDRPILSQKYAETLEKLPIHVSI